MKAGDGKTIVEIAEVLPKKARTTGAKAAGGSKTSAKSAGKSPKRNKTRAKAKS